MRKNLLKQIEEAFMARKKLPLRRGTPIGISFAVRKGGVGKTTLVFNMAAFFANEGYKVLVIGCDSQEDVTESYLIARDDFDIDDHLALTDVLSGTCSAADAIVETPPYTKYYITKTQRIKTRETYTLDMLPAGIDISELDSADPDILKNLVEEQLNGYDFIFFDTPPSDKNGVMQVLMACDYVICPVTDNNGPRSVRMLLSDVAIANGNGGHVKCLGVVCNLYKSVRRLNRYNLETFRDASGDLMFNSVLRDMADVPAAQMMSTPLCSYEVTGEAHEDYMAFYDELKKRIAESEEEK